MTDQPCHYCPGPFRVEALDYYPESRAFALDACCEGAYNEALQNMRHWTPAEWQEWFHDELGVGVRRALPDTFHGEASWPIDFGIELHPTVLKKDRDKGKAPSWGLIRADVAQFVRRVHRHAGDRLPSGNTWKWVYTIWNGPPSGAVAYDGKPNIVKQGNDVTNLVSFPTNLIGVAIVTKVGARTLERFWHKQGIRAVEVARVALDHDLPEEITWKACSTVYKEAARDARARGYDKVITYTLESESGMSLRYARYKPVNVGRHETTGRRGDKREGDMAKPKTRWEKNLKAKNPSTPQEDADRWASVRSQSAFSSGAEVVAEELEEYNFPIWHGTLGDFKVYLLQALDDNYGVEGRFTIAEVSRVLDGTYPPGAPWGRSNLAKRIKEAVEDFRSERVTGGVLVRDLTIEEGVTTRGGLSSGKGPHVYELTEAGSLVALAARHIPRLQGAELVDPEEEFALFAQKKGWADEADFASGETEIVEASPELATRLHARPGSAEWRRAMDARDTWSGDGFEPMYLEYGRELAVTDRDYGPYLIYEVWDVSHYMEGRSALVGFAWLLRPQGLAPQIAQSWIHPSYADEGEGTVSSVLFSTVSNSMNLTGADAVVSSLHRDRAVEEFWQRQEHRRSAELVEGRYRLRLPANPVLTNPCGLWAR